MEALTVKKTLDLNKYGCGGDTNRQNQRVKQERFSSKFRPAGYWTTENRVVLLNSPTNLKLSANFSFSMDSSGA